MLQTLKLVRGAVADKDIVQALTHFFVYQGRIQGCNGRLAIDAACPELDNYSFTVPADRFVKAIDTCEGDPTIDIGEAQITIKEGRLKVRLPILANDAFPRSEPDPMDWETEKPILPALKAIRPFVATDAAKPWSIGVWISDKYLYATNNVILVRHKTDLLTGTERQMNLPVYLIDELLRINKEPNGFGIREDTGSVTFYFDDGFWLKGQLISAAWPVAVVHSLFDGFNRKKIKAVPKELDKAVNQIMPFCKEPKFPVIALSSEGVATEEGNQSAAVEGFNLTEVKFNGNMLKLVLESATNIDFQPANIKTFTRFFGKDLEGVITPLVR